MPITQIGKKPVRIAELNSTGIIYNRDSANPVFWGIDQNACTSADASILDPGAGIAADGSHEIWLVALVDAVAIDYIDGATVRSPTILNANVVGSVNISGTPNVNILGQSTSLDVSAATVNVDGVAGAFPPGKLASIFQNTLGSVSATANSSTALTGSPFDVSNYLSIILRMSQASNNSTATGAAICSMWLVQWLDASGNTISRDVFSHLLGTDYAVQVPVKGSKVNISLVNVGTTGTITVAANNAVVWGDYRQLEKPIVLNYVANVLPVVTGWTVLAPSAPSGGVAGSQGVMQWIASFQSSGLVVSTQYMLPLTPWEGLVNGWWTQSTNALAHDLTIVDLTFATQGNVGAGTAYQFGMIMNVSGAVSTNPSNPVSFYTPPTQLALLFETSTAIGATLLFLTGA